MPDRCRALRSAPRTSLTAPQCPLLRLGGSLATSDSTPHGARANYHIESDTVAVCESVSDTILGKFNVVQLQPHPPATTRRAYMFQPRSMDNTAKVCPVALAML